MDHPAVPKGVWFLIIAMSVCLTVIFFYFFNKWDNRYGDFNRVDTSTGIQSKITVLEEYKGYTYVRLANGDQYVISNIYNKLYNPKEFYKHVFSGDSISKQTGSDTLYLHKEHSFGPKLMYFLINR